MRRFAALVALLIAPFVVAGDFYLQTVASTSPTSAASTVLTPSIQHSVQCDAPARYRTCALSTCTATSNDMLLDTNKIYDVGLDSDSKYIAVLASTGTANCRIYRVNPRTLPE